ncbi:hypothetical protein NBH00_16450 [Paraconexibacter antarcticus]|uniref:Hint domain-containing protein n=1 Tax=Paraconexibacter antarcticus TaxID=2949664 RepID=A0ABY5DM06_9ACTN|nr:radical SAM protein [Paraconexibacter antarcticus]UTI62943.1 hypothetical protein NBH00_16450 [Paraconexibacter antarcticus]
MRWENLTTGADEGTRLPGYRDAATVRTFDAPEALRTRFYEVRAKSVLNRVPERSRMPFRWTINPYRGCSHACTYCMGPDTPVLMADGRHRRIADLRAGDRIYGTERRGVYRRFVRTEVLAKWNTTKPAYRIELADGTTLTASGDHRFLTDRGWKHVTAAGVGEKTRPYLTSNNRLIGSGAFADPPRESAGYRTGYLCGIIRGDGTIGHRPYHRRNGRPWTHHLFRLALIDEEALLRVQRYLIEDVGRLPLRVFASAGQPAQMIRTQSGPSVARIEDRIAWPEFPDDDWRKGFLAGIFDAEGHRGGSVLRISNSDPEILRWTMECCRRFGFDAVLEGARPSGVRTVRLRGGLSEHLRFIHLVDPAIRRKCSIDGQAVKTTADLGVVSVTALGTQRLCDITTSTGDFIANGVVSHNCFARPTHTFLGFDAGQDFEREIVVKVNTPEVLRAELARPSWRGEHVALGTNTDPYQWVEGRYRLMRGVWEALRDAANPCSVLTKSPLLLRDLDLLLEVAAVTDVSAALSVPTIDERAWRATEPHTPNPRARLEAVAELNRAGIPTSVLVAPLMPGINDDPRQVEEILTLAAAAGATNIGGVALHLRGEVRGVFMDWLRSERPDLVALYEELYERGAYAPERERVRLARLIAQGREARPDAFQGKDVFRTRGPDGSLDPAAQARFGPRRGPGSGGAAADGGARPGDGRAREAPRCPPVQTSLF